MPDEVQTPDPAAAAAALAENATLRTTLQQMQADNARLLTESQTAAREREALKVQVTTLEPRAKQADELKVQVDGYINAGREAKLVEALQGKLPGGDALTIRGVVIGLHEQGKINRFAEDTAAAVEAALPIITAASPGLTRPPTGAGGSSLIQSNPTHTPTKTSLFR